jgi:hypothetical protein
MAVTLNASTSSGLVQTADTSGTVEIQSNGTTKFTVATTGAYGQVVRGTAVTASSTSVDFTSIPSWVKRITVMIQGVSTSGTSELRVRLGTSGGFATSGYLGAASTVAGASATTNFTAGFDENASGGSSAAAVRHGAYVIQNLSSNNWICTASFGFSNETRTNFINGSVALGGALTQVRITTANGTDTFDAGTINILYEG